MCSLITCSCLPSTSHRRHVQSLLTVTINYRNPLVNINENLCRQINDIMKDDITTYKSSSNIYKNSIKFMKQSQKMH